MQISEILSTHIRNAMTTAGIPEDISPMVAPSKNPSFGHYQANCAMASAKRMKQNPREVATDIVEALNQDSDFSAITNRIEIAGPGFINIHLSDSWLSKTVEGLLNAEQAGLEKSSQAQTIVVDYSSPNLAKEMHVGHLRSTIIGDVLARVLEAQGNTVIRQNHVGDWGTQFGMLITHLKDQISDQNPALALSDLEQFYRESKQRFDDEEGFADRARNNVVKLQSGDEQAQTLWQQFINISIAHSEEIYDDLNVTLKPDDIHAESAYNDALPGVIEALQELHLVKEDQGAQAVFLEELADKKGNITPIIVQKSDGGYLYATTDLAAAQYRSQQLNADRVLYFIDARQSLHMKQVFTLSRKAAFVSDHCSLEHHPFGTMMGKDGKPFKTRTGGTIKLSDLLKESVVRADKLLLEKESVLPEAERKAAARKIGIGAIKYADLAKTRTNDYVFNWENMLSFEGNTAPYLQYAYTRIQSIFRKAELSADLLTGSIEIGSPQEQELAIKLLQYSETVDQVAKEAYPHLLCNYLYELTSLFMKFYEACPILKSDVDPAVRISRLLISQATANTIRHGLNLLGIEVMDRM